MAFIGAKIFVRGIVQGVGFRPFIHRQVEKYGLKGFIRNTSQGAELALEGDETLIDRFLAELPVQCPPLAFIESVSSEKYVPSEPFTDFHIAPSLTLPVRNTLISPDVSLCEDCRRELFDPSDRRYRYPFLNCTNCGPRFTIIRDIPYDRPKTTMAAFPMCPDCEAEYHDIRDRRYHAQPFCCPVCGPVLSLYGADGTLLIRGTGAEMPGGPLDTARRLLREGKIVAVKGLGGIHLACLPQDEALVTELRRRKKRDRRPFALMCRDADEARKYCEVSPEEEAFLASPRRPIVLLRKKADCPLAHISENEYLGIMLPYTPLHELLLEGDLPVLVMTSANLSELPILFRNEDALRELSGIADAFLLHDRDIHLRCDDSLLWVLDGKPYFVRRSRGYVPLPLLRDEPYPAPILACGAEQKASFALCGGRYAFAAPHIGDLKNQETLDHYENMAAHFERFFEIRPQALASDLHPDYLSTHYAEEQAAKEGLPLFRIQHHHAHLAACLADNRLAGPVIGIIWDGTGLGTDGSVWGGEFLTGDASGFERAASVRPFRLPGGDKAVKEPWRAAVSLLLDAGADAEAFFSREEVSLIRRQTALGLNAPWCSSMGRLFDAAAAVLGLCREAAYEGQGAILLEAAAAEGEAPYPFPLVRDRALCGPTAPDDRLLLDERPLFRALAADCLAGVPVSVCAGRFHAAVTEGALAAAEEIRRRTGLDRAALSGGCFQNQKLMRLIPERLAKAGFRVYHHERVSVSDEGISLGQAEIAAALLAAGKGTGHVSGSTAQTD